MPRKGRARKTNLPTLTIRHRTAYRYRMPVNFGPHRVMLRPRETPHLRVIGHDLETDPAAATSWARDVFGNAVATLTFKEPSDTLVINSLAEIRHEADPWPVFDIAASAANYPFLLGEDEMLDLGALRLQAYLDTSGQLRQWAQAFVAAPSTNTLALLKDLSAGAAAAIAYEAREEDNTQSPAETLQRQRGSCRDIAVLFVDAVRSLGFGAHIVSGYLHDPDNDAVGTAGLGSTHAWAEVYVPGAGWITFDPTNRSVGDHNLIPVAVAREIHQVMPVSGSFAGDRAAFQGMDVAVQVAA